MASGRWLPQHMPSGGGVPGHLRSERRACLPDAASHGKWRPDDAYHGICVLDSERQVVCLPDAECQGILLPDDECQGMWRPDDARHSKCLPDDECQGIYHSDDECQGICLLDAARKGISFDTSRCIYFWTMFAGAHAALNVRRPCICVLDENEHSSTLLGDECQSVALSFRGCTPRLLLSGQQVPGHFAFRTQSVRAYFFQTTSARALCVPDAECQGIFLPDDEYQGMWRPDDDCQGILPSGRRVSGHISSRR